VRIFTNAERRALTRKPVRLEDAPPIRVSPERLADLLRYLVIEFDVTLASLDRTIEELHDAAEGPPPVEFLARSAVSGALYLVNTEGYDYARYLGRVAE
jgi:hypothetical protein